MPVLSETTTKKRYFGTQEIIKSYKGSALIWNKPVTVGGSLLGEDIFDVDYPDIDGKTFQSGVTWSKLSGTGRIATSGGYAIREGTSIYTRGDILVPDRSYKISGIERVNGVRSSSGLIFRVQDDLNYCSLRRSFNILAYFTIENGVRTNRGQFIRNGSQEPLVNNTEPKISVIITPYGGMQMLVNDNVVFTEYVNFNMPVNGYLGFESTDGKINELVNVFKTFNVEDISIQSELYLNKPAVSTNSFEIKGSGLNEIYLYGSAVNDRRHITWDIPRWPAGTVISFTTVTSVNNRRYYCSLSDDNDILTAQYPIVENQYGSSVEYTIPDDTKTFSKIGFFIGSGSGTHDLTIRNFNVKLPE